MGKVSKRKRRSNNLIQLKSASQALSLINFRYFGRAVSRESHFLSEYILYIIVFILCLLVVFFFKAVLNVCSSQRIHNFIFIIESFFSFWDWLVIMIILFHWFPIRNIILPSTRGADGPRLFSAIRQCLELNKS